MSPDTEIRTRHFTKDIAVFIGGIVGILGGEIINNDLVMAAGGLTSLILILKIFHDVYPRMIDLQSNRIKDFFDRSNQ